MLKTNHSFIASLSLLVVLLLASASPAIAQRVDPSTIIGTYWNAERDAQIEIYEENGTYQGRIAWVQNPGLDDNNPDPSLRDRPVLGLDFLKGFTFDGKKTWSGGRVYSPDNGKTYKGKMWMEGPNTLRMRGFVGVSMLGRTESFERVEEGEG